MSICLVSHIGAVLTCRKADKQLPSADVSNTVQLHAALDHLYARLQRVDGCVTAAGICIDKPFADHTSEDFHRQLAINVSSHKIQ